MKTPAQSFFHQPINEDAYPTVTSTQSDFNQHYRAWKNWAPGYVGASHSYTNVTIPSRDFRGRVAHQNGFVYFFPMAAGIGLIRIDPAAKTSTTLANTPSSGGTGVNKWHGAIASPTNPDVIYLIPYDGNSVGRYSISGNSFTTFGSLSTGCCKYINAIAYKNKIYCISVLTTTDMLVIDASNDTASTVAGAKAAANHTYGTPFAGNNKIYFPPYNIVTTWRIYNITTNSFSNGPSMTGRFSSMAAGTQNWSGGLVFSTTSAAATASVWRYNTSNDTLSLQFTYTATGATTSSIYNVLTYGPDGSYWGILSNGGLLSVYLSSTNSATYSFDRPSASFKGVIALNGNFCNVSSATNIVVVENNTNWDFTSDLLMSPFNTGFNINYLDTTA